MKKQTQIFKTRKSWIARKLCIQCLKVIFPNTTYRERQFMAVKFFGYKWES